MPEGQKRKTMLLVILVAIVLAGSFYTYRQNMAVPHVTTSAISQEKVAEAKFGGSDAVIYISGWVVRPGVYKVNLESRVLDAVNIAGGFTTGADASKVNLAQKLKDGMHIHVPGALAPLSATDKSSGPTTVPNAKTHDKVNINAADLKQLDSLPGIGPALAGRIVDYRQANGGFKALEELKKVPGIGEAKYNQLKDKITL